MKKHSLKAHRTVIPREDTLMDLIKIIDRKGHHLLKPGEDALSILRENR